MWFNSIFPPETGEADDVFSNLMVISTSLALGLIVGFVVVRFVANFLFWLCCCGCGDPCTSPNSVLDDDDDDVDVAAATPGSVDRERAARRADRFRGMCMVEHEDPHDQSRRGLIPSPAASPTSLDSPALKV